MFFFYYVLTSIANPYATMYLRQKTRIPKLSKLIPEVSLYYAYVQRKVVIVWNT